MKMDEVLYNIAEKVKNFAVIYLVDITKVPDFNKMYVDTYICIYNKIYIISLAITIYFRLRFTLDYLLLENR